MIQLPTLNREIMRENYTNRDKPQKELLPLKEEPALFYREMCEAGILGVIQSAEVPIRALYDRKNIDKMTFETLPTVCDIRLDEKPVYSDRKNGKGTQVFPSGVRHT